MKVYTLPPEVDFPKPDYSNYDSGAEQLRELEHVKTLYEWLLENGFKGKHTGAIFSMPMADGAAKYMLADGSKSCLIHLPYGDAWDHRDASFIPKKEVVSRSIPFKKYYDNCMEWVSIVNEASNSRA